MSLTLYKKLKILKKKKTIIEPYKWKDMAKVFILPFCVNWDNIDKYRTIIPKLLLISIEIFQGFRYVIILWPKKHWFG